jgi:uncharacterized protein (TIGR00288 family)
MNSDKKSLAVFIDVENIYYSTMNNYSETPDWEWIVETSRSYGRIASIQAFGDWNEFASEISRIQKEGIQPVFVPRSQDGKSSLDCHLTVAAMKLFFQNKTLDTLILVSGDRDYIPLLAELKAIGKEVHILAVSGARSGDLTKIVDNVLEYSPEKENAPEIVSPKEHLELSRASELVIETIHKLEERYPGDRWVNLAPIGLELKKCDPNFSHKDYGYAKLVDLLNNIPEIEIKYDNYEKTIAVARIRSKGEAPTSEENHTGTIDNLLETYGFIHPDDGGENIFFHESALEGVDFIDLQLGDKVRYDTYMTERGPNAGPIILVDASWQD